MLSSRLIPISLLTLFILFTFSANAYAVSDRCPRHNLKTVMKSRLAKTKVFKGTSRGFTDYTQGHSRGGSRTLGFVEYRGLTTRFETKFEVVALPNDNYCVKLTKVIGYFDMNPKLFMPTDYSKKSCEYQQILKHENRHLQALKDFHKHYAKKFESHLGRIARTVPIPRAVKTQGEIDHVAQNLHNYFVNEFKNFEYRAWSLLLKKQAKIDSPQEYRGVSKRCKNWDSIAKNPN